MKESVARDDDDDGGCVTGCFGCRGSMSNENATQSTEGEKRIEAGNSLAGDAKKK